MFKGLCLKQKAVSCKNLLFHADSGVNVGVSRWADECHQNDTWHIQILQYFRENDFTLHQGTVIFQAMSIWTLLSCDGHLLS